MKKVLKPLVVMSIFAVVLAACNKTTSLDDSAQAPTFDTTTDQVDSSAAGGTFLEGQAPDLPSDQLAADGPTDGLPPAEQVVPLGGYVTYSPTAIANATVNGGKAVLFFHASWCPTCKAAEKDILGRLGEIPDEVTIIKTDYDTYRDLKQKYNITYQHTFVQVDSKGNEIIQWNGGQLDEILTRVQ